MIILLTVEVVHLVYIFGSRKDTGAAFLLLLWLYFFKSITAAIIIVVCVFIKLPGMKYVSCEFD